MFYYPLSKRLGTTSGYNNTVITSPLNTSNYPHSMPFHSNGITVGTPPQFFPSQEPLNNNMLVNCRQQYIRSTSLKENNDDSPGKFSKPLAQYLHSSGRRYPVSTHMNYIQPLQGSSYVDIKKSIAIGKNAYTSNNPIPINSTKSFDNSYRNSALRRVRSSGSAAPKKKGSIYNTSLRQSGINGWGSLPKENY
jgi:hypothetical protein